jgi:hypothetical protein
MGRTGRVAFIGKMRNVHRILLKLRKETSWQELDVDGRMILNCALKTQEMKTWNGLM